MQKKDEKLTNMGLLSYIQELGNQDLMKLKVYVASQFGKSYITISDKFAGRRPFSPAELLALQSIIANESWRQ